MNEDLMILKMQVFDNSDFQISGLIDRARKHKALIVDLRGNGGGAEETLKSLLGGVMDHEVKVGDLISRENAKPVVAKSKGKNAFAGKLIVLIDSESASASELFARMVQLEKRGTVLGDRSSGSVMRSREYPYNYSTGTNTVVSFGASITDADVIMSDGKSLEHHGVTPDEILIPAAADLATGRDPVMARAAELAGVKISPEKAGSLFPYEWPAN
jgi:carboxyl-terminal processing protease